MAEQAILNVSLKDYKKKIDELRASLLDLDSASEDYKKTVEEIQKRQEKYNEVMQAGKDSAEVAANSYNAVSKELSSLKKEWKNMDMDSKEFTDTAKRIDELNDTLKNADGSVGVFSRNVGNYASSFVEAFKQAGAGGKALGNAINAGAEIADKGLKTLLANPIGLTIAAVAAAVKILIDAFKRNEEATNKLKKAMVPFQAILTAVQKVIDKVVNGLADFAVGVGNFVSKLIGGNDELKETEIILNDISDKEAELAEQRREATMQDAEDERAAAELRNKAADKSKYNEQERIKYLKEAGELEKAIANRNYENAKKEYEIIKEQNSLTASSAEDRQKEADAYARMVNAQASYFNKTKEITGQISEITKSGHDKVKDLLDKVREASKTELEILEDKYNEEMRMLKNHSKEQQMLTSQYEKEKYRIKYSEWEDEMDLLRDQLEYTLSVEKEGSSSYYYSVAENLELIKMLYRSKMDEIDYMFESQTGIKDVEKYYESMIGVSKTSLLLTIDDFSKQIDQAMDNAGQKVLEERKVVEELNTKSESMTFQTDNVKKNLNIMNTYYKELTKLSTESMEEFKLRQKRYLDETLAYAESATEYNLQQREKYLQSHYHHLYYDIANGVPHNIFDEVFAISSVSDKNLDMLFSKFEYAENAIERFVDEAKTFKMQKAINIDITEGLDFGLDKLEIGTEEFKNRYNDFRKYMEENGRLDELDVLPEELANASLEAVQNYVNAEKDLLDQRLDNWMNLSTSVGNLFGGFATLYKTDIDNRKKMLIAEGKTEEQANAMLEDSFDTAKKIEIAQATISTIAGAIEAFMKCQELGQPWGFVLGTIQAAAVTAAGLAQIKQIQATTIGNTSTINGTSGTEAGSTPTLNEYKPQAVTNITGASDTDNLINSLEGMNIKAYVVESDIESSRRKAARRNDEATF